MDVKKLLTCSHSQIRELTPDQWRELPTVLLKLLSEELSVPLEDTGAVYPDPGEVQPGVTLSFQSLPIGDPGFCVRIEGIMGLQSEPGRTIVVASLFLFLGEARIRAEGYDFYELELKVAAHGVEWHRLGWQKDIYGEFESVRNWGELSRTSIDPAK